MLRNRLYYTLKPFVSWSVRNGFRRWIARRKRGQIAGIWPILPGSERPPEGWPGWPDGKKFAFILTHDVEGPEGVAKVKALADLERSLGFRSSFNFIPEGSYQVTKELRDELTQSGFEVGVHDLHHDGRLYASHRSFSRSAESINGYLKDWDAVGFRSGFMLHNLDWLHQLQIAYDASTFDTDPFEPQPDHAGTIFPFWVPRAGLDRDLNSIPPSQFKLPTSDSPPSSSDGAPPSGVPALSSDLRPLASVSGSPLASSTSRLSAFSSPNAPSDSGLRTSKFNSTGYVELPYTLVQDSTLFLVLREKSPEIWIRKLDWIAQHGGMALVNVHPDYLQFPGEAPKPYTFPVEHYRTLLQHVRTHYTPMPSERPQVSDFGLRASDSPTVSPSPDSDLPSSRASAPPPPAPRSASMDVGCSMLNVECSPSPSSGSPALPSALCPPTSSHCWHALPHDVATFVRELPVRPVNRRPLRVAIVTHSHYRSDNRVIRYGEALASRGDFVDALGLRPAPGLPSCENVDGVHLHRLQDRFAKNEQGVSHHLRRSLRYLMVTSAWLTRQHLRQPYDLVHIHNIPDFLVFAAWYPRLRGAKVILDIHDIVPEFYTSKFASKASSLSVRALLLMEKWSARFAHHVIIANDLWRDKYATRTGTQNRCTVFINNVNTDVFPRSLRRLPSMNLPLVMFPGGLQWHQGLDIAIRAMPRVIEVFPRAEFHIYGEGPMKAEWMALANSLGLAERVKFLPEIPVREVAAKMAVADLGVVPKRADSFGNEAYSTKIMEFMALGVPVVASSTRVDRHYFDDSLLKFFESGNSEALATAILEVLQNREETQQRVARAVAYAAKHSWETRKQEYLNLVDTLCATK